MTLLPSFNCVLFKPEISYYSPDYPSKDLPAITTHSLTKAVLMFLHQNLSVNFVSLTGL